MKFAAVTIPTTCTQISSDAIAAEVKVTTEDAGVTV